MRKRLIVFLCLGIYVLVMLPKLNMFLNWYGFSIKPSSDSYYTIYKSDSGCKKLDKDCSIIDRDYKNEILKQSDIPGLTINDLAPIMGPCEIEQFLRNNDGNPQIYTPTAKNIKKGIYQANLHTHSTDSDGRLPVSARLDEAQQYAQEHNIIFYIATTDHNTVNGAKTALKTLKENPNKYKNVKLILGMEINSIYNLKDNTKDQVDIHVLTFGINPYNKFLNEEFCKPKTANAWNRPRKNPEFEDFDNVIKVMNNYGIVGVAHPARYIVQLEDKKYDYLSEMLQRFKSLTPDDKPLFIEGYYQSYWNNAQIDLGNEYTKLLDFINNESRKLGIIRDGSLDTHGLTILGK